MTKLEHEQLVACWQIWPGAVEADLDGMLCAARETHGPDRVSEAIKVCEAKALTEQITVAYFWGVLRTLERTRGPSLSVKSAEVKADVADSYIMHKVRTYETDVDDLSPEEKRAMFRKLARGCERGETVT